MVEEREITDVRADSGQKVKSHISGLSVGIHRQTLPVSGNTVANMIMREIFQIKRQKDSSSLSKNRQRDQYRPAQRKNKHNTKNNNNKLISETLSKMPCENIRALTKNLQINKYISNFLQYYLNESL